MFGLTKIPLFIFRPIFLQIFPRRNVRFFSRGLKKYQTWELSIARGKKKLIEGPALVK